MNKLISLTWLLLALRSFRRFTLHVQCTSSTNHWLVPSVKTIEPVVANDMVIRKPRFSRQTEAKQARSASRPSKKGIRKTKSEFIRSNTNSEFTDNRLLIPGFMGVGWTALQLHFNFLLLDLKLLLEPSQYRIVSALGSIMLHRAFSDPTRCNPVLI